MHASCLVAEPGLVQHQRGQGLIVGEPRGEEQVSFSKKQDYLLRRAELLDRDDELSKAALEAKNVLRRLL